MSVIYIKSKDRSIPIRIFPILMAVLLLTYPSFILVPAILIVLLAFQTGVMSILREGFRTKKETLVTLFFVLSLVLVASYIYFQVIIPQTQTVVPIYTLYSISGDYVVNSIFGYSIILCALLSFFLIALNHRRTNGHIPSSSRERELTELTPVLLTYLLTALVLLLTQIPQFNVILRYVLPSRLTILVMLLSIVLNIYAIGIVASIATEKLHSATLKNRLTKNKIKGIQVIIEVTYYLISLIILLSLLPLIDTLLPYGSADWVTISAVIVSGALNVYLIFRIFGTIIEVFNKSALRKNLPVDKRVILAGLTVFLFFNSTGLAVTSLSSHASLALAGNSAWFSHSPTFQDSFNAMEWVNEHAKSGERILNDWSFTGLYLESLSIKNVTMLYILRGYNITSDLQEIWLDPKNVTLVQSLLEKYNVSYILVTSEYSFYNFLVNSTYMPKPYTPHEYVHIFTGYPFLQLVFESGDAAVFKTA